MKAPEQATTGSTVVEFRNYRKRKALRLARELCDIDPSITDEQLLTFLEYPEVRAEIERFLAKSQGSRGGAE